MKDGPKSIWQLPVGVLVIANAEDDDISLITLDTLDILDKEPFFVPLGEEFVKGRVNQAPETTSKCVFDVVGVPLAKGYDTQCLVQECHERA